MMTASRTPSDSAGAYSLWDLAWREAATFKWLESERNGYDVGPVALQEWCHRYWRIFCRYRRIEHLTGVQRIREFDEASFATLNDPDELRRPVVSFVVERFVDEGWENLHFVFWAEGYGFSDRELHDVLDVVDVNSARFDPPWSS